MTQREAELSERLRQMEQRLQAMQKQLDNGTRGRKP
jgi:hypothetical protein